MLLSRQWYVHRALLLCLTAALLWNTDVSHAAAAASVDASNGYAGRVMDKIVDDWAPPPGLRGDFKTRLVVSVDGSGKVTQCTAVKPSEIEALDSSVCGIVRQIGSFGTPPGGAPITLHLSFWTGIPKGKPQPEVITTEEAMRMEVRARTKAEAAIGDMRAITMEETARDRAEAAAKAQGADLPEVRPAPVAPEAQKPKAPKTEKKHSRARATVATADSQATQLIGRSTPDKPTGGETAESPTAPAASDLKIQPTPSPQPPAVTLAPTAPTVTASGMLPEAYKTPKAQPPAVALAPAPRLAASTATQPEDHRKYISNVRWQLLNAITIPVQTPPGQYVTRVRLTVDQKTGEVENFTVVQETGDAFLDRYVLRDIAKVKKVKIPPADFGADVDITLTLVRRKSASDARGKQTP